ncbi:MAG: SMC-Scp complex subunit ScpB [Turicibacter sp.]|uniref:Segregation and condensation protein B n=1 Tax=Turicibacter faecis TaxID=2963365 RepID=A0ABN6ZHC6_9FIRM|nr:MULTISPECIES: SMC-Scp complex subunit ScpB [unclassified Turicibacter]MCI8701441.1 SMC-Scp complex subunit ScpB [Turicibacter sp.]BEH91345.1 segregation and condensation protein B [Turicibacter sp. TC023]MCI9350825.1 SMC-Scp complex subunit ScpB [Turicibacter sp.]MCU7203978.1 SMC-Scp complex subunit ScpB [Turicibacter sp. TA25]MCU7208618.1 SMC-Scp complex subunit ScpB [Turicibacter sp. 1E2]
MFKQERLGILEGLLFAVGDEGITPAQVEYVLEVNKDEVNSLLLELKDRYQNISSGVTIIEVAGVYKMTTKKEHAPYLKRLIQNPHQRGLSNAALEVLAIVAYRQPITRHEIENIRGASSDNVLRKLLNFSLIEEGGRLEGPGRPILFKTTDEFLDYFGIKTLEELPELPFITPDFNLEEESDLFNFSEDEEE